MNVDSIAYFITHMRTANAGWWLIIYCSDKLNEKWSGMLSSQGKMHQDLKERSTTERCGGGGKSQSEMCLG